MWTVGPVLLLAAFSFGGALVLLGLRPKTSMSVPLRMLVGILGGAICILAALPALDFMTGQAQLQ
jgi:uncharacterized membrane protein